jgi:hypothetical protein
MKTQKEYESTPIGAFRRQRANARRRDIPWDMTFEQWQDIWNKSGKWEERGVGRNKYCMSRIDDEGAYCPENVEIKTQGSNRQEYLERRWKRPKADLPQERKSAWDYRWDYGPPSSS